METRSSNVLVGGVVLALAVALFAFILWLARFDGGREKAEYDIFFPSVSGLAQGSAVNFAGVPVGQITSITLDPARPENVRVRIEVAETVPVKVTTAATSEGVGFTGVSIVSLEGGGAGDAPLTAPGPFGVPVIRTKPGALQGLLQSAPELLNNASQLLTNLNELLNAENKKKLGELLVNVNATTETFAQSGPQLRATLDQAKVTLAQTALAANQLGKLATTTETFVGTDGAGLAADLRATSKTANAALADVGAAARAAKPMLETLTQRTLPEANAVLRELSSTSGSLGAVAGKIDEDPLGAVLGGRSLPDYTPSKDR